jgi:hypothetical protein
MKHSSLIDTKENENQQIADQFNNNALVTPLLITRLRMELIYLIRKLMTKKKCSEKWNFCMKTIISSVLFFLLISSCKLSDRNGNVEVVNISPVDSLSVFMGLPLFADFYDNKLFVMDIHGENGFMNVIDVQKDSLLFSFAKRGNGPNEYLHIANINISSDDSNGVTIGVYDPASKRYRIYSYDSLCVHGEKTLPFSTLHLPRESRYTELISLNSAFIATDLSGKSRFVLFDDSLKNERYVCNYRPKPIESIPNTLHAMAHHGKTVVSPDRKTIANIIYIAELFSVFHIDHNEVVPAWDYIVKEMDYITDGDRIKGNTPLGYLSAAFGDKYIYGLFCGKEEDKESFATYADEVHVFSQDGKLIKKLHLEMPAFGITIDREKRMLYTIVHEPDPQILIYHLPE